jgi:hypothetical protein
MAIFVRIAGAAVAAAALLATTAPAAPSAQASTPVLPKPTTTNHFIVNLDGSTAPRYWGFNIFDTGSNSEQINGLPRGVKALVYLGEDCPSGATASFRSTVHRLSRNHRVFAYYLADEPSIAGCPKGPAHMAAEARYIRSASGGAQKSFIVLIERANLRAFRPGVTHVDMVGIDPYPCTVATPSCPLSEINQDVGRALRNGIPRRTIVPVYQAFGQGRAPASERYYKLPSATVERGIIRRWASLIPHPQMDYAYTWGHQSSANPTLKDSLGLKRVFKAYFSG